MKSLTLIVVTLGVAASARAGFLDGIVGAVKDTSNAIKQDIGGVVDYGKHVVFGNNKAPSDSDSTQRSIASLGVVDTISLKIHDAAAHVREHFRGAIALFDKDQDGKGLASRMFDKMKTRIFKIKLYLFGDNKDHAQYQENALYRPSRDVAVLREKLQKYIHRNSSSTPSGAQKTLHGLTELLERLRNNVTRSHTNINIETDGAGLIDVRFAGVDLAASEPHRPAPATSNANYEYGKILENNQNKNYSDEFKRNEVDDNHV